MDNMTPAYQDNEMIVVQQKMQLGLELESKKLEKEGPEE